MKMKSPSTCKRPVMHLGVWGRLMLWAPYWVYSRALSMVWGQNPPKKVFLAFYYLIWLKTYSWYLFKKSIKTYSWYFSRWWEKYLSKRSLIKHTCSWRVNLLYYEHWTDKRKYFYVYSWYLLKKSRK